MYAGIAPVYYEIETVHQKIYYNAGVFHNHKEAAVLTDKTVFVDWQRSKNKYNRNDKITDKASGSWEAV